MTMNTSFTLSTFGTIRVLLVSSVIASVALAQGQQSEHYFPGRWDDWQRKSPAEVGMDPAKIEAAIAYAMENFNPQGGYNAANEGFDPQRQAAEHCDDNDRKAVWYGHDAQRNLIYRCE